jgi:nitrogenase molybdenum-iron protein beta chain
MANLKTAIHNVFSIYNPDIIAIHTTCLSETIGDDIPTIISNSEKPEGKYIIHANTPSYIGSHIVGFSNMTKGMVAYLSRNSNIPNGKINIIPGFVNPGDMREIKRILRLMGVNFIMFPDTSNVMDAPLTGNYNIFPKGGTKVEDIIDAGNSKATLALGSFASRDSAYELRKKCKVQEKVLEIPIGINAMDDFLIAVSGFTGKAVPEELEDERGQIIDIMADLHQHYYGKRVAVFGDPDILVGITSFLLELGMIPKYVLTGTPGAAFDRGVEKKLQNAHVEGRVKSSGDLFTLHQWIKNDPVDLLIGNTYGKYIARAEDIPFVRIGFPIMDRGVHSYMPIVGYRGALRLLEMIGNALLDREDRDARDENIELIM